MENSSEELDKVNIINNDTSEEKEKPTKIKSKKSVKKNYFYNLIYEIFLLLVPLVVTPYVSRVLTPEGVGKYSFTFSLITYFTIFGSLGFATYAQREIAKNQDDKNKQSKSFWEINICRLIPVSIALIVNLIFCITNIYQGYTSLMFVFIINIIAVAFDIAFFFQGNEEFGKLVIRNVIIKCLSVAAIFIFVKNSSDLLVYALINSIMLLVSNLSMWPYLIKSLKKVSIRELKPLSHLKGTIILFIPTIAISIYTVLDKTLIGILISDTYIDNVDGVEVIKRYSDLENGFYEQAEKIIKMIMTIITCIGTVMTPRNTREIALGNTEKVKDNIKSSIQLVFFIGLPLMFGIISISSYFVPWFFGEGYDKCVLLMMILSPLIIIIGLSSVFGRQYLIPTGQDKKFTIAIVIGAVVNLILNVLLIPFFWSIGAAIATIIGEIVVTVIMGIYIFKDINLFKLLLSCWKYFLASTVMFCVCFYLSFLLEKGIFNMFLIVFIGCIIYFGLLIILNEKYVQYGIKIFDNILIKCKIYSQNKDTINRNVSIDLIKIIACFLVVMLHTIYLEDNYFLIVLYNLGVVAIPLFFMVNGFLILKKENITYMYCLKKIFKILKILFIWCSIYCILIILLKRDFNVLKTYYLWIFQKGIFANFWFFGSMIIIYLCLPLLKRIYNNNILLITFLIILFIISFSFDLISIFNKEQNLVLIPQTFRLWMWIFYYMLGGFAFKYKSFIQKNIKFSLNIFICILFMCLTIALNIYFEVSYFEDRRCEFYYMYLPTIVSVFSLFILFIRIDLNSKYIVNMACYTTGIYILHQIIISFGLELFKLNRNYPLDKICLLIIAFIVSYFVSFVIKRIKYANKLIEL